MSFQNRKVEGLARTIRKLLQKERSAEQRWQRPFYRAARWAVMLYHEFVRDEVRVRAESLSYLLLFSSLPLIAGAFFVFNIFAKFGMVQEAIGGFLGNFLETIPEQHRAFVLDYALKFKDSYLDSLGSKSGTLGIFALAFLIWVGLNVYSNVDRMLNHIWSSEQPRPFLEQLRNFLVVSIVAPLVLTAALSLPLVLRKIPVTRQLLESLPFLAALLNWVLPLVLLMGVFSFLYRFVPVRRVRWRAALIGGAFAAIGLIASNMGMALYFRFGIQTAYGAAAALPLIGFWIYVAWVIIILGAEIAYLQQNGRDLLYGFEKSPTLREAEGVLALLARFLEAHRKGHNPITQEELRNFTRLDSASLRGLLDWLQREKLVLETRPGKSAVENEYALARDISSWKVGTVLANFIGSDASLGSNSQKDLFRRSLQAWAQSYGDVTFDEISRLNGS